MAPVLREAKRKRLKTYGKQATGKHPRVGHHQEWDRLRSDSDSDDSMHQPVPDFLQRQQDAARSAGATAAPATHPTNNNNPSSSQGTAMMSVEPTDSQIRHIQEVTAVDPETARRYLKVKRNDLNQAISAILDCVDINELEQKEQWDETAWNADRDGGVSLGNNIHPLGSSAGPTRGPSPAPSTLGLINPTSKDDEDRELQQALAASQGLPYRLQESGMVTQNGSDVPYGPQLEDRYANTSQWALVPTKTRSSEILPDVDVLHRENDAGEPRLLKPLPDGDYTPNLLTILHSIPGARDALLLRHHERRDYGDHAEWWHGHEIPVPTIVHVDDGMPADMSSDRYEGLIAEVQRIMAFLDGSSRSYAAIESLRQIVVKNPDGLHTRSGTLMELMLETWLNAAASTPPPGRDLARRFSTIVGTLADEGMDTPELNLIPLQVHSVEGQKTDLLELLDGLLLSDLDSPDNFLETPADVLVFRLSQADSNAAQLGVEIPAQLYLDKYLHANLESSRTMRQRLAECKKHIAKVGAEEEKLMFYPHPKKQNEKIDVRQLLQHTVGHYNGANRVAMFGESSANPSSDLPPNYPDVAERLSKVIIGIDEKLQQLAKEKEKLQKMMSEMSKQGLPGTSQSELKYRYTLRGVATKSNITYLLRPQAEAGSEDAVMESDAEDTTPKGMQWWRIDYEVTGYDARIRKTKAQDYDVLRAAELEHNSALLVYANDRASDLSKYEASLPAALRTFVERDNDHFASELADERDKPLTYSDLQANDNDADVPRLSVERRDSVGSTFAQGGSPPAYQEEPDDWEKDVESHSVSLGFGPRPTASTAVTVEEQLAADPEPVDIVLDEVDDAQREDVEMVEKPHAPLLARRLGGGGSAIE